MTNVHGAQQVVHVLKDFQLQSCAGIFALTVAAAACGTSDPVTVGAGGSGAHSGSSTSGSSSGGSASGSSSGGSTSGSSSGGSASGSSSGGSASGSSSGGSGTGGSSGTGKTGACGTMPGGAILPLAVGNSWTYKVTDSDGTTSTKTNTVDAADQPVGQGPNKDVKAFKLTTSKKSQTDKTVSWQALVDGKVVRYREDSYSAKDTSLLKEIDYWDPYRLHADGSTHAVGESWTDSYKESKVPQNGSAASMDVPTSDTWVIVSDYECISVPEGTGANGKVEAGQYPAIRFKKTTSSNTKQYLYVPGIGKIREEGSGQTEELTGFTLSK